MKIIARAVVFPAPSTLFAWVLLVWCHCVCSVVHAKSLHHLKTSTVDNGTEIVANCDLIRPFFDTKNITLVPAAEDFSNTTCYGKCCSKEMEERLKQQARLDFHNLIHHHSRSLQGLLVTTADALRDTVIVLLRKSENQTLSTFNKVYSSLTMVSRPLILALYQTLVDYVSPSNTPDDLQQPLTRETLQERFREFFTHLFPIAYRIILSQQDRQDFTEKFKSCLYETMDDIQPFGDMPQDTYKKISKSLEATRVLMQALSLGKTFLDKTDSVLFPADSSNSPQQEACYNALLRMTYCPKCKGIGKDVRSCNGFCMNVIRGCLTQPAYELDLAWSGYVETVGRLVAAVDNDNNPLELNIKNAVRDLDTRISGAIMYAMERGPSLEEKVRKVCGRAELLPSDEVNPVYSNAAAKSSVSPGKVHAAASSSLTFLAHDDLLEGLHKQIGNFMASFETSRVFYMMLADTICEEYPRKHCWNGERIGEYTKTVVVSSPNAQRYNPEITLTTTSPVTYAGNTNISALIDQLRHINQLVQTQLASSHDIGMFLADEALEGSGSGDSPVWKHPNGEIDDDEDGHDDDRDDDEASGSGMGPTTTDPSTKTHQNENRGARSSAILLPITFAIVCASLIA